MEADRRPTSDAEHWDSVYGCIVDNELSWFQEPPSTSLRLLNAVAAPEAAVVDVGAGKSKLATALLDAGWSDVTVLDVSAEALRTITLDPGDPRLTRVIANVLTWRPQRTWALWHDRGVFHFLVQADDRSRYIAAMTRALAPGGVAVIGTFAADGPTQCSGLPTARYDADALASQFTPTFVLEHSETERHVTPAGGVQPFTWVIMRRVA